MLGKALDTNEPPEDVTSIRNASDCNGEDHPQGYSASNNKSTIIKYFAFWKLNWLVSKKKHNLRFIFWQPVRGLVQLFLFIGKKYCRFPFCAFPVEHEAIIYMNGPELRWKFHCLSFPSFHIFARLLAIMSRLRNWRYFKPQLKVMSDQNVQTILIASNSNT